MCEKKILGGIEKSKIKPTLEKSDHSLGIVLENKFKTLVLLFITISLVSATLWIRFKKKKKHKKEMFMGSQYFF
jgi:uncharacterized membrane protein YozB (DUF420 family)